MPTTSSHSSTYLRALALDFAWHPDLRAAWRAGLSLDALAAIVQREAPRAISAEEAVLVADAAVELLQEVCS